MCTAIAVTFFGTAAAQRPEIINKATLPEIETVSSMRVDDPSRATGIPRADLVIKDMCFNDPKDSMSSVGVLIANIGTADAGPFMLGFEYVSSADTARFAVDHVEGGLKAGEEVWMIEAHICCGWAPRSLVYGSTSFVAIADPRYYSKSLAGLPAAEVKSVIPESNEANNKMSAKKSELRSCTAVTKIDRPTPTKVQPVRPTRP